MVRAASRPISRRDLAGCRSAFVSGRRVAGAPTGSPGTEPRSKQPSPASGCEVDSVVAAKCFGLGQLSGSHQELVGDGCEVEGVDHGLELGDRGAQLRVGEASSASGGGERGACFHCDERDGDDGVGGPPDRLGGGGAFFLDDQLEQCRGVDVGDHRGSASLFGDEVGDRSLRLDALRRQVSGPAARWCSHDSGGHELGEMVVG
jgi:hypothetical protein